MDSGTRIKTVEDWWNEIRVDTFTNYGPVVYMRLYHIPTGVTIKGEGRFRHRLKEHLFNQLLKQISGIPQPIVITPWEVLKVWESLQLVNEIKKLRR